MALSLISLLASVLMSVIFGVFHAVVALEKSIFFNPRKPYPYGKDCGKYAEFGLYMLPEKTSKKV